MNYLYKRGGTHYCNPRKIMSLEEYQSFEIAIINHYGFVTDMSMLENFNRLEELMECYMGQVFGYVPKDLVNDLYVYMKTNFK